MLGRAVDIRRVSHHTFAALWIQHNTLLWRCCEHPQQRQRNTLGRAVDIRRVSQHIPAGVDTPQHIALALL